MSKDDLAYVGHMLDTAEQAHAKFSGRSRAEFDADENLRIAPAHLLQVVGEAARRVSPRFRDDHPGVPWSAIIGMRHKVVHDYLDVDYDIVWDTLTRELPPLIEKLKQIVSSRGSD